MRLHMRLAFLICAVCCFLMIQPAYCVDLDDDFDIGSWFGGSSKKSKKQNAGKKQEKNKADGKTTNEAPKSLSEKLDQNQSVQKETQSSTPVAKKQPSKKIKKKKSIAKKIIPTNADLLTKVRTGAKFTVDEMESWIVNTANINACYENGQTMLLYLITRYTDIEPLRLLIENGADIQTHCTPRYEALFIAAINNPSAAVTELLLNNGANMVERDYEKNTALILAATFNPSAKVLTALMDFGLKANTTNKYGYDALMLAAYENGRIPIIQVLLDNEANVNSKDPEDHTPLMAAAIRGRDDVMKYMITRGADFKATDKNGLTVLDYYNKRHYLEILDYKADEMLSPSARLSQEFKFIAENHHRYNNALKQSIYEPNADKLVADSLKNLADVDILDEIGCTPLLNAAKNNNKITVLEKLINANANISAKCMDGQNALMFIASQAGYKYDTEEQIEKVEYLLKNGIDINATDDKGSTALMYAVANQADNRFILNLINHGADINLTNSIGESALWIVTRQEASPETLKLLIEYGADTNKKDASGETPIWYQLRTGGNESITSVLLRGGAEVDIPNAAGDLPLWYAFYRQASPDIIEGIIANQSDVNIKNETGDTPLLYAVKNDYPASTIKLLLERGANPEIPDKNGYTMQDILESSQFFNETMQKITRERVLSDW